MASRWDGVRLPRASGKSPDFPGSFSATSPEVFRRLPRKFFGDCGTLSSQQSGGSPEVSQTSRKFPGGQPLSLGSLTPSPDSQKLSLNIVGKRESVCEVGHAIVWGVCPSECTNIAHRQSLAIVTADSRYHRDSEVGISFAHFNRRENRHSPAILHRNEIAHLGAWKNIARFRGERKESPPRPQRIARLWGTQLQIYMRLFLFRVDSRVD